MFRSNTIFLPYIQIVSTIVALLVLLFDFSMTGFLLSILMYVLIGCFGISIGYHRYLSHKSFKLKYKWSEWILLWLGCLAGTGSPIGWVAVHREHHRKSDRPGDPHSPHTIGAKSLIAKYEYTWDKWPIRDLIVDKTHRFVHDNYFLLLLLWGGALSLVFGITLAIYLFIIPMCLSIWASTISNYVNHKFGYLSYDTPDKSRNLWATAYITFGEGWHNNHHARPKDYRFGKKWWELDLGAFFIKNFLKA